MTPSMHQRLTTLKLSWFRDNLDHELAEAARLNRPSYKVLERLIDGELTQRNSRAVERLLKQAKLPARKTLESFDFSRPKEINADQVRHLFTLNFMHDHSNVVLIGNPGVGKTHLALALAATACENRKTALFTSAVAMINDLARAQRQGDLDIGLKRYLKPNILVVDELGYLPVDKLGAELLFQILAGRYDKASTIITTNRAYSDWIQTFANDNAMTAAVLDRVVHRCNTVRIIGDGRVSAPQ